MGKTVIVVGSGVAAALIARGLLERYSDIEHITLLEAGNTVEAMNRRKWIDYVTTGVLPYDGNRDVADDYISTPDKVVLEDSRLFVRGGSTMHWGGWALRYKEEDFHLFSAAQRERDWPYDYATLEPYYHLAEQALGIAGDSSDNQPHRNGKAYPFSAPAFTQADGLLIGALKKSDIAYSHLPIARFANRCITTGTCKYCPVGGRFSAAMLLDELLGQYGPAGKLSLLSECAVHSVIMDNQKSARGVEYLESASGKIRRLAADITILCAGAIETPKILLSSRSEHWPQGLGNHSGHVGKHFKTHAMLYVTASLPSNEQRIHQELDFPTLCSRHFDSETYQRDGKFFSCARPQPPMSVSKS